MRTPWVRREVPSHREGTSRNLASAPLGVRGDGVGVGPVDDRWTGEHRLAAPENVTVALVQPQLVDGLIALQVGLLVDGELDAAVLDRADQVTVQVEGGDLGRAA